MPDEQQGEDRTRATERIDARELIGDGYIEKADVRPQPPAPDPTPEEPSGEVDTDGPVNRSIDFGYIEKSQDSAQERRPESPEREDSSSN